MRSPTLRPALILCVFVVSSLTACGGGHELERYSFGGSTVAVADYTPPAPALWTGAYEVDDDDIAGAVVDAGSQVAREVEARRARARLDSAAALVNVRERFSRRTVERAARYLGAAPVQDASTADYLIELFVRRYGIDARSDRAARLFMNVEAVLLDRRSGHEVWSVEVDSHDRLTPAVARRGSVPVDIVTAATLHTLSIERLREQLEGLTEFTADYVTAELREDLRDVRRR